ncbi:DNA repair protein RecO [Citricoccus sp. NPDC055426]|uniref:DNA repair protein RecO n=1 Tax=Citricoccus sp. NPDC055426 TaxID=3155536 RepID=UPI00343C8005
MAGSGGRRGAGYAANSYRTDALVLRTYTLGEADRIIVLLTPGHGQIRAVAKGVRRTTSKFGATLEPFMLSRLQLVHGRNLDIITQAESVTPYGQRIAQDYDAYAAASAMVETAERLTAAEVGEHGGGLEAPSQYRLLHGALAALARGAHAPRLLLDSYLLRSLATAGWAASFSDCARCGAPGPHRSVNVTLGGSVCDDCRPPGSATPAPGTITLLAALFSGQWDTADASPDASRREAAGIVAGYLQFHLERHLKSLAVMDQGGHPPARQHP